MLDQLYSSVTGKSDSPIDPKATCDVPLILLMVASLLGLPQSGKHVAKAAWR